jgi:hypothetical protein
MQAWEKPSLNQGRGQDGRNREVLQKIAAQLCIDVCTVSERRITERRIIERRIIERRIIERRITERRITERRKLPNVEYYRTSNITEWVEYYRT